MPASHILGLKFDLDSFSILKKILDTNKRLLGKIFLALPGSELSDFKPLDITQQISRTQNRGSQFFRLIKYDVINNKSRWNINPIKPGGTVPPLLLNH